MVISIAMSMLMGCNVDFENRRLPDPVFHAEDLFGQKRTVVASNSDDVDPFAELSATDAQPDVTTQNLKNIGFASVVKSSLPHDAMGGGWNEATTDTEFLLIHEESSSKGTIPSAIVYGYYDPTSNDNATLTTRRFLSVVDPNFTQTGLWELNAFISTVISALSIDNPISETELQTVLSVFKPTLGLGLGYHSAPETFTGWKWVGQNPNGVVYTLGKTTGKFVRPSEDLQSKIRALEDMSQEELLSNLSTVKEVQQASSKVAGIPAEMILGTMTYEGQVVYISMMCLKQPTCSQKSVLIDLLNNMSPLGAQDMIAQSLFSSPSELGQKYGLPLFQTSSVAFNNAEDFVNDELTKLKNDQSSIFTGVNTSTSTSASSDATGDTASAGDETQPAEGNENGAPNTPTDEDSGY